MKWLREPVTRDFLQGMLCGMVIMGLFTAFVILVPK